MKRKIRIFYSSSFDNKIFGTLFHIIVAKLGNDFEIARIDSFTPGVSLLTDVIHEQIKKSDIVIADLSGENRNVLFEFGIANASNIPIIPIISNKHQIKELPTDLQYFNYILYDESNEGINMLAEKIRQAVLIESDRLLNAEFLSEPKIVSLFQFEKVLSTIRNSFSFIGISPDYLTRFENYDFLRQLMENGVNFKILILDPESDNIELIAQQKKIKSNIFRSRLRNDLLQLTSLVSQSLFDGSSNCIRLLKFPPPSNLIRADNKIYTFFPSLLDNDKMIIEFDLRDKRSGNTILNYIESQWELAYSI
jgi:hypothetical protein